MHAIQARETRQAEASEDGEPTGLAALHKRIADRVKGRR
jgi:hypothetical protein